MGAGKTLRSAPLGTSRLFPIGKVRQRGKRTRIGRRLLNLKDCTRAAREARQSERKFLGNRLPNIDKIVNEGLERHLIVDPFFALVLGRTVAQRESCRHGAVDRIERHVPFLRKGSYEASWP